MNKLTKEQAQWFLASIKPRLCDSAQAKSGVITYDSLVNFIENQCTEKPFPIYHGNAKTDSIKLQHTGDDPFVISIWVTDGGPVADFTKDEFKQFTEGCNKIAEWLNNENK